MDSKDSKFYPGIARNASGTVDLNNPKTLILEALWVAKTPSWLKCDTWCEFDGVSPERISPQQKTPGSDKKPKSLFKK
jgi:hypothetical protein